MHCPAGSWWTDTVTDNDASAHPLIHMHTPQFRKTHRANKEPAEDGANPFPPNHSETENTTNGWSTCIVQPVHVWLWVRWHAGLRLSVDPQRQFFTLDQPTVDTFLKSYLVSIRVRWKTKRQPSQWIIAPSLSTSPAPPFSHHILIQSLSALQTSPSSLICLTMTSTFAIRGKHHVHSGRCPEIKQYAVTEKTQTQSHAYTRRPVVTPRQRRQTTATGSGRLSMWRASVWNPGTIWALHCWQNSLGTLALSICIYGKTLEHFCFFCCFSKYPHQSACSAWKCAEEDLWGRPFHVVLKNDTDSDDCCWRESRDALT